jgi:hypothetical protein
MEASDSSLIKKPKASKTQGVAGKKAVRKNKTTLLKIQFSKFYKKKIG